MVKSSFFAFFTISLLFCFFVDIRLAIAAKSGMMVNRAVVEEGSEGQDWWAIRFLLMGVAMERFHEKGDYQRHTQ